MIQLKHDGSHISLPIDSTGFTNVVVNNAKLPYVRSLIAGRIVNLGSNGKVELSVASSIETVEGGLLLSDESGAILLTDESGALLLETFSQSSVWASQGFSNNIGVLLRDVEGETYGNKSSLSSPYLVAIAQRQFRAITDQIDSSLTYAPSDLLYAGESDNAGLLVNTVDANATATFGALLGLTVTPIEGAVGNFTLILQAGGTAGAEVVTFTAGTITVTIEDGVSTQGQIDTALTAHPWIESVATASAGSAVTLDGDDANNQITGSGGSYSAKPIGVAITAKFGVPSKLDVLFFPEYLYP